MAVCFLPITQILMPHTAPQASPMAQWKYRTSSEFRAWLQHSFQIHHPGQDSNLSESPSPHLQDAGKSTYSLELQQGWSDISLI